MSTALVKIDEFMYRIDNITIHKYDKLWNYTMDKVNAAKRNSKSPDEFKKKMLIRMLRLKNKQKLYYAIAYLKDIGEDYLSDLYDAKIVADKLLSM